MRKKWIILSIVLGVIAIISIVTVVIFNFTNLKSTIIKTPEDKLKLKESEINTLELTDYENSEFTMKVPKGWEVTTGGTEMLYAINIKDPLDERNQIFVALKASPFLKSNSAKQWHKWYVDITRKSNI